MIRLGACLAAPWILCCTCALAQTELTTAFLRLPERLHVVGVMYRDAATSPLFQFDVYESLDRVWARQDSQEGSLGFTPQDLTESGPETVLLYNVRARRGMRDDRFARLGTTRIDGLVSPMAWARLVDFGVKHGDVYSTSIGPHGELIVTLKAPHATGRSFECSVDLESHQLIDVRQGAADAPITFKYKDWREISSGLHVPFVVEIDMPGHDQTPPLSRTFLVSIADPVTAADWPPPVVVHAEAVIDDRIAHLMVNGAGQDVTADQPSQPSSVRTGVLPVPSSWWTPERIAIGGGIALIVLGVVVRLMRRK